MRKLKLLEMIACGDSFAGWKLPHKGCLPLAFGHAHAGQRHCSLSQEHASLY